MFFQMFGTILSHPLLGWLVDMDYDFFSIDTLSPIPVYG